MKLQKIKLTNFRRFLDEEIILNPGLNVFVGPNNSGKSTILEAIGLNLSYPSMLGEVQLNKSVDTGTCVAEITLTLDQEEWRKALNLVRHEFRGREEFKLVLSSETLDRLPSAPITGRWQASFSEGRRTSAQRIFSFSKPNGLNTFDPAMRNVVKRALAFLGGQNLIQLFRSTTLLTTERRSQTAKERVIFFNALTGRVDINKYVRNRLYYLKERSSRQYDDLKQKIISIFDLEDFDVSLNLDTGMIDMTIVQNGKSYDINEMGGGTRSFLLLFSHLYLSGMDIAIIDEPETNMHPLLVQKLVTFLRTISKGTQLILTSHNETLIRELYLSELYRVEYIEDKGSKVRKLDTSTDFDALLELLGVYPSRLERAESRFTRILVFTEGDSDKLYIERFAERSGKLDELRRVKPTFWPLGGKRNLYRYVNPDFIETLTGVRTPILLVLDRDEDFAREIQEVEEKIGKKRLHYLKKREIESYLLDPKAILKCMKKEAEMRDPATQEAVKQLTGMQIKEKLSYLADKLKRKVILIRFLKRVLPLRFFYLKEMGTFVKEHLTKSNEEIVRDISANLYSKITGVPPKDLFEFLIEQEKILSERWNEETKLDLCPAKDLFTEINKWIGSEYGISISKIDIIDEMEKVNEDIIEIINKICNPTSLI